MKVTILLLVLVSFIEISLINAQDPTPTESTTTETSTATKGTSTATKGTSTATTETPPSTKSSTTKPETTKASTTESTTTKSSTTKSSTTVKPCKLTEGVRHRYNLGAKCYKYLTPSQKDKHNKMCSPDLVAAKNCNIKKECVLNPKTGCYQL